MLEVRTPARILHAVQDYEDRENDPHLQTSFLGPMFRQRDNPNDRQTGHAGSAESRGHA
jgi:hypothetical protein